MKVVLKADVKGLGRSGATVEVADGYARNYLIPRGLALSASSGTLKSLAEKEEATRRREERVLREADLLKNRLDGTTLRLFARCGDGGKLFGSITAKDVAEAIQKAIGSEVDKRRVEMKEPIRSLGTFPVLLRLGHDVAATVHVAVEAENK